MAGRPTKYTPETVRRIVEALRMGATRKLACQYGGITEETFSRWMECKVDFVNQVNAAEGQCAITALAQVKQAAAAGDPANARWLLERRFGYSQTVNVNLEKQLREMAEVSGLDVNDVLREARALLGVGS